MPKRDHDDLARDAAADPRYAKLFAPGAALPERLEDWGDDDPRIAGSQMRLDEVHAARAAKARAQALAAALLPPDLTDAVNRRALARAQSVAIAALAEERAQDAKEEREREQLALDAEEAKLLPVRALREARRAVRRNWIADNGGSF